MRDDVERRHRFTAYPPSMDDSNYLVSCQECYNEDCEFCDERNQEYVDAVMGPLGVMETDARAVLRQQTDGPVSGKEE